MSSDRAPIIVTLMPNWSEWEAKLSAASPEEINDVADALAAQVLSIPPDPLAVSPLVKAFALATSDLSQNRLASALAWAADPEDAAAVDCLGTAYRKNKSNPFLGSSFLGAIGLLSLRGYTARTETLALISRLQHSDNRQLLVCAAKVIGLLDDQDPDNGLRRRLSELAESPIPPVKAEAQYQLALMSFRHALGAEAEADLVTRLQVARDEFVRAELSEEIRPDAALFASLTSVVIELATVGLDPAEAVSKLREEVSTLRRFQGSAPAAGYRSYVALRLFSCVAQICQAAEHAAQVATDAPRSIDLMAPMVKLADAYQSIWALSVGVAGHESIERAMRAIADRTLAPQLGPLLNLWVGLVRLAEVIATYESQYGENDTLRGLRILEKLALASKNDSKLDDDSERQLATVAALLHIPTTDFIRDIVTHVKEDGVERLAAFIGSGSHPKVQRLEHGRHTILWRAICSVFDRNSLEQMLRTKMNVRFEDVAPNAAFMDQVFKLIDWAEREGRVVELARVAQEFRPSCVELRDFVGALSL